MPDLLLPRLKREIEARLDELRPLVAEAERLEAAKAALLAEAAAERTPRASRAPRSTYGRLAESSRTTSSSNGASVLNGTREQQATSAAAQEESDSGRAPRGANQTAILAIVEERPGVSVAEIASVTKIPKPTVASTVSKLKRDGVLADEAFGVKLASRQPLTLSAVAAAAAPVREDGVSDEEWEKARRDAAA